MNYQFQDITVVQGVLTKWVDEKVGGVGAEGGRRADKSAVGTVNRPLRLIDDGVYAML
jgi:hypothetical protein